MNWMRQQWFPSVFDHCWSGQSASLGFFSDLGADVLKTLGVVIIEGEHPGSSHFAAELRGVGPIQRQLLPASDTRHHFNPHQICKTEDGGRLAMGI